jgi:catalase
LLTSTAIFLQEITMPLPTDEKLLALSRNILEQFDAAFGYHAGFRPAHAKGALYRGVFTPSAQSASLTMAPHVQRASTPVTVRFSDSPGVPEVPDNIPDAFPRGMAIRFNLAEHSHTDIISHTTELFPASNGEEFFGFLKAVATSDRTTPSDPKNPKPIEKFLGSHPAALAFVTAAKAAPASFARQTYFGISAYKFTNASGASRFGRYRIVPALGNEFLEGDAAKGKSANYLFEEMTARLASGAVEFRVMVQLANAGDVTDNACVRWPGDRELMELGKIVVDKAVPNDAAEQKQIIFDSIPRVAGIDPSADPLIELRASVYLMSGRRRRGAK